MLFAATECHPTERQVYKSMGHPHPLHSRDLAPCAFWLFFLLTMKGKGLNLLL